MKTKVNCAICNKEELVAPSRLKKYKTCSLKCLGELNSITSSEKIEKVCPICNKSFKVKRSHSSRRVYCSKQCQGLAYTIKFRGTGNPNFKYKNIVNGYECVYKINKEFLHSLIVKEVLGIEKIPKGFQTHHRDCDRKNNKIDNLVLLSNSDHRWLHKQYGNATLWAYYNKKISREDLISWSDDKERASKLLDLTIEKQQGVFKLGELLENPEMDNQQPSSECSFIKQGSEKVQRLEVEEIIIPPRVPNICIDDDIVRAA